MRDVRIGVAGTVIALLALAAVGAPVLAPHDPLEMGPQLFAASSFTHPLGTDSFGRDTLSRILYGARSSLFIAALAVITAGTAGTLGGVLSAAYRGAVDWTIMRFTDLVLAFPPLILAIAAVTFLGPGYVKLALVIAVLYFPTFARLSYASALAVAQQEYLEAARAQGGSMWHQIRRHILPNIASPIIVQCSLSLGFAILVESGLSFLGLGVPPPAATWGRMVSESRKYMEQVPLLLVWPSLAIALAIGSFNLLGDALRDAFDPRLRRLVRRRAPADLSGERIGPLKQQGA
jgi:peptide/nickel transport system permease protein